MEWCSSTTLFNMGDKAKRQVQVFPPSSDEDDSKHDKTWNNLPPAKRRKSVKKSSVGGEESGGGKARGAGRPHIKKIKTAETVLSESSAAGYNSEAEKEANKVFSRGSTVKIPAAIPIVYLSETEEVEFEPPKTPTIPPTIRAESSSGVVPAVEERRDKLNLSNEDEDVEGEQFEVERIIDMNTDEQGQRLFKVKWKNYGFHECTWEPRESLDNAKSMLEEFFKEEEEKRNRGTLAQEENVVENEENVEEDENDKMEGDSENNEKEEGEANSEPEQEEEEIQTPENMGRILKLKSQKSHDKIIHNLAAAIQVLNNIGILANKQHGATVRGLEQYLNVCEAERDSRNTQAMDKLRNLEEQIKSVRSACDQRIGELEAKESVSFNFLQ